MRRLVVRGIPTSAVIGGLALTSGVALTATSGWLIVAASFRPQILTLLAAIVLVRAFGIARPFLRYVERVRSHDAALHYLAEERASTYSALVPLTPARLGRRSRGDVLTGVVDDLDDLAYAQVRVVVPLVALAVTGAIAAFVASLVLLAAGLVVLSAVVAALLVGALDGWIEQRTQARVVAARAGVGRLAALVTGQGLELAAAGAHGWAADRLAAAHDRLRVALRTQAWGRGLGVGLMPVVTAAHAVAMVAVVAPWVDRGLPTPIAAFLVLTPVALGEVVSGVPDAMGALARARSAHARLTALLALEPAVAATDDEPPPDAPAPAGPGASVQLTGVHAAWVPDRPALAPLDLDLPAGTRLAVVGGNGSGKSTLLAVLARHLDPSAGTYRLDGQDAVAAPLWQARAHLAVVDDETHVFASTLRENLRLARPDADDGHLLRALRLAGLGPWFDGLDDGLDTRIGAGWLGVSGGERTRLGIARALASARPILLLDEPAAHLDSPTATAVLRDVAEATRERTVIIVGHRPEGLDDVDATLTLQPPRRLPRG